MHINKNKNYINMRSLLKSFFIFNWFSIDFFIFIKISLYFLNRIPLKNYSAYVFLTQVISNTFLYNLIYPFILFLRVVVFIILFFNLYDLIFYSVTKIKTKKLYYNNLSEVQSLFQLIIIFISLYQSSLLGYTLFTFSSNFILMAYHHHHHLSSS